MDPIKIPVRNVKPKDFEKIIAEMEEKGYVLELVSGVAPWEWHDPDSKKAKRDLHFIKKWAVGK